MKSSPRSETLGRAWHEIRRRARQTGRWLGRVRSRLTAREKPHHRTLDWTEEQKEHRGPLIAPAKGLVWYGLLLLFAVLFTQVLRSRVSNMFFWFVLLVLPALFLYALTARAALRVYLYTEYSTVDKMQSCPYEIRIINGGILAYPFVDAVVRVPRHDAVRTTRRRIRMSLQPLAVRSITGEVTFRHRGTYEIGVCCFYVYDFFHLFRIRIDVDDYHGILVLPRKRLLEGQGAVAVSDTAQTQTKSPFSFDRLELLDVRDYRLGDALRDVHWKLSSKAEELLVKDYSSGASGRTIIYCDLTACYPSIPPVKQKATAGEKKKSRRALKKEQSKQLEERLEQQEAARREKIRLRSEKYSDQTIAAPEEDGRSNAGRRVEGISGIRRRRGATELYEDAWTGASEAAGLRVDPHELSRPEYYDDMNEYCADGVVELAVSTVLRELRAGNRCMLMWFDARAEMGAFGFELTNEADFDAIFRLFATAPLCPPLDHGVGKLRAMLGDTQGIKQVFVSAALDGASLSALCELPGMAGGAEFGASELVYYNPEDRFAHPSERRTYLEECRVMLGKSGILMVDGSAALSAGATAGKEGNV
jgi:hypothetical protein